jgi:thiol-disulfide isomerase/thioredoxin
MKKPFLLFTAIFILNFIAAAQKMVTRTRRVDIGETAIVTDTSGTRYPYVIWKKLLSTGNYVLKSNKPASDSTRYLLVELSAVEKNARAANMPKPLESPFFTTGEKIKLFNTKDINGDKIKLKELAGKVIVLNFWFIGCPPCREEIPELNKIAIDYASNPDVVFVAVCLDEKADIKEFLKDKAFSYHIIDYGRAYADLYKLNLYPTNVVLDRQGIVRFHGSGLAYNTPLWIRKTIDESLESSPESR